MCQAWHSFKISDRHAAWTPVHDAVCYSSVNVYVCEEAIRPMQNNLVVFVHRRCGTVASQP